MAASEPWSPAGSGTRPTIPAPGDSVLKFSDIARAVTTTNLPLRRN